MAVSPESITVEEPSNTALATSEASARVGLGAWIIDSSIWVAVMTGRPTAMQRRMISFWRCGSSSIGNSDAEVATGDHHRAGGLDDGVEVLDRGSGLDLGHDERASRARLDADAAHVVGRAHERQGEHVDADLDEGVGQAEVVGGRGGEPQPVRGDVEAGPTGEVAAVDHPDADAVTGCGRATAPAPRRRRR